MSSDSSSSSEQERQVKRRPKRYRKHISVDYNPADVSSQTLKRTESLSFYKSKSIINVCLQEL